MLTDHDIADLERATLDAVAPHAVETLPGWLLPFDASTIGRAKSAVPLSHQLQDADIVHTIADRYAVHGLSAAFRVADSPALAHLHRELHRLCYQPEQPTLVQIGSAQRMLQVFGSASASASASVTSIPTAAWSDVYLTPGFDPVDGVHRVQALSRSKHVVYASLADGQGPAAAGTAAFSHQWASIHGMRTALRCRGQGLAGQILASLAQEAISRGLDRVFLQVQEDNTAALALYQRAGFATAWRYHYWRGICV
ncbi:MAG: GNAT family N-acetyltransferase [Burkholderiales bacterium]|nr:GNAT family N-acetyltransferase [Burkholderiales bacterium]